MRVEIWSDIVCPWCYIGKRRFESALAGFEKAADVEVVWRSFELNPNAPRQREGDLSEHLASKYGMTRERAAQLHDRITGLAAAEGLEYRLGVARPGNTFDGHRVIHLAAEHGLQGAAKERLLSAYFTEGEAIVDRETVARLASDIGLDRDEVRTMLEGDAFADAVRADEREAAELGIDGVPFFVFDRRYGVSGAQPSELIAKALETAWTESRRALPGVEPEAQAESSG